MQNSATGGASYVVSGSNFSTLSDLLGGAIAGGGTNPLLGQMNLSGLSAGQSRTFTLTVDPTSPNLPAISASHDVQFVRNRAAVWEVSNGQVFNLGRHMLGQASFAVTLNSGADDGNTATNLRIYENASGTQTTFHSYVGSSPYFVKQHSETDIFNGANQQVTVTGFLSSDGKTSREVVLSDKLGGSWKSLVLKSENLLNEQLSVEAKSIVIEGTALADRSVQNNIVNLNQRVMLGQTGSFSGSTTAAINSYGSDNFYARLRLLEGNTSGQGVTATVENEVILSGSTSGAANVAYNVTYGTGSEIVNSSSKGYKVSSANISSLLESGEDAAGVKGAALAGQSLPTNVDVGVGFTVVEDRHLAATSRTGTNAFVALAGSTVNYLANAVRTTNGQHTTQVGLVDNNGGSLQGQTVHTYSDQSATHFDTFDPGSITQNSTPLGQVAASGSRQFTLTAEGLEGENAQENVSYDWQLVYLTSGTYSVNFSDGALLTPGSTLHITHTGNAGTSANLEVSYGGGWGAFTLTPSSSTLLSSGQSFSLSVGTSENLGVGVHQSRLFVTLTNDIDFNYQTGDVAQLEYILSYEVIGPSDGTKATKSLLAGTKFSDISAVLTNNDDDSFGTTVEIIDSLELTADVGFTMSFEGADLADGAVSEDLSTDAVDITGLSGEIIVIQVSYNEADLIEKWGTEDVAVLTWWDEETEQWINAVAGNSDGQIGTRFAGSYADYLATQEGGVLGASSLGDYGYDAEANVVWAVVDHNSTFGGGNAPVPEPSTILLILGGGAAFLVRRRRN